MKKLLLGDEAIAQGALDAGLSGVYAYPGTPSTEITEYIQGSALARSYRKPLVGLRVRVWVSWQTYHRICYLVHPVKSALMGRQPLER